MLDFPGSQVHHFWRVPHPMDQREEWHHVRCHVLRPWKLPLGQMHLRLWCWQQPQVAFLGGKESPLLILLGANHVLDTIHGKRANFYCSDQLTASLPIFSQRSLEGIVLRWWSMWQVYRGLVIFGLALLPDERWMNSHGFECSNADKIWHLLLGTFIRD